MARSEDPASSEPASKQRGDNPQTVVITDAQSGRSKDLASRQRRYAITMGFRTLCFIAMIFVGGPGRWVLLAGAVFLPYIAVVLANQANNRTSPSDRIEHGEPTGAPQLSAPEEPEIIRTDPLDPDLGDSGPTQPAADRTGASAEGERAHR